MLTSLILGPVLTGACLVLLGLWFARRNGAGFIAEWFGAEQTSLKLNRALGVLAVVVGSFLLLAALANAIALLVDHLRR